MDLFRRKLLLFISGIGLVTALVFTSISLQVQAAKSNNKLGQSKKPIKFGKVLGKVRLPDGQVLGLTVPREMFPDRLEGLSLDELEDYVSDEYETREFLVEKCYIAYYINDEATKAITVDVTLLELENRVSAYMDYMISSTTDVLTDSFEADYSSTSTTRVSGYSGKYITFTMPDESVYYYYKYQLDLFVPLGNYLIQVTLNGDDSRPSLSKAEEIAGRFIGELERFVGEEEPETVQEGIERFKEEYEDEEEEEPSYAEAAEDEEEEEEYVEPTEPECGKRGCETWLGETCVTCPPDCKVSGFCCSVGDNFLFPNDFYNDIINLHEAVGGLVPNGAFVVGGTLTEDNFQQYYEPKICKNGEIVKGFCTHHYHCVEGVCVGNECKKEASETYEKIESVDEVKEIVAQQNSYRTKHVANYLTEDTTTIFEEEEGLDIKLVVQGNTAGKIPKVTEGDEVEVRLEIENVSDDMVAVVAGIIYPGHELGGFRLTERSYTMSFGWWWKGVLNWASLKGSFLTKLIGGRYIVMPKESKLYIYSKVVPEQTGYLDVQGMVYYTPDTKYTEPEPDFMHYALFPQGDAFIYDTSKTVERDPEEYVRKLNYQEIEMPESILVEEEPCGWLGCW